MCVCVCVYWPLGVTDFGSGSGLHRPITSRDKYVRMVVVFSHKQQCAIRKKLVYIQHEFTLKAAEPRRKTVESAQTFRKHQWLGKEGKLRRFFFFLMITARVRSCVRVWGEGCMRACVCRGEVGEHHLPHIKFPIAVTHT